MSEASARRAFIQTGTALVAPPACPEIRLHLASAITPIWHATEKFLDGNNLPPPYWAFAWAGGQALARHILDTPWQVRGRRVLDFAAGSGIAGVAAALAGAASVEASDVDAVALEAVALNAEANGVEIVTRLEDLTDTDAERWDVVLAGDVCYERPMAERCFPWLQRMAADGAMVLLADPGRAYLPDHGIVRLAAYTIPTSREIESHDSMDTVIYQVTARSEPDVTSGK